MCSYCETACVAPRSWSRVKLQAQQTDASEAQTVATQKHFMLQSAAVHAAVCDGRTCWASTSHTPVSPGRLKPFSRWRAAWPRTILLTGAVALTGQVWLGYGARIARDCVLFFFGLVWSCRALVPWVWSLLQFRWRYTTSYYIFSFLFRSWHRYLLMLQQQNKKSKKNEGNWKKTRKVKLSLARKNESQQNESLFDGVLPFGPFCVSCTMTHMDSGGVSIPPWSA